LYPFIFEYENNKESDGHMLSRDYLYKYYAGCELFLLKENYVEKFVHRHNMDKLYYIIFISYKRNKGKYIMKKVLLTLSLVAALYADIQMAPDGTYVNGEPTMAPDGTYVGSDNGEVHMAPDGTYIGGSSSHLAPNGKFIKGSSSFLAPDGTYTNHYPQLAPDGTYK